MKRNIIIRENHGDNLLDHLLYHRGIIGEKEREIFLNPDYETGLHDPYLMKDMDKAVERIEKAIKNNEKIVIFSDYDCDGIPGAVALAHFFKEIGYKNIEHYIPHRHDEGFGLNEKAIESIAKTGANLIITIDCGIADIEEAKLIKEFGMDLIVTDHHEPLKFLGVKPLKDILPEAVAILNHKQSDCQYPEKILCGAGVVFKLIQALLQKDRRGMKEGKEKWMLDMVGLATLSDMVPLVGENRVLAKYGLTVLQKSPRPGISHLLSTLRVNQRNLNEEDIQFMITPRINVASRMGNPRDAFLLLATSDFSEADRLVQSLNQLNDERKGLVASTVKEIKKKISERGLEDSPLIVLGNPNWKPPILGLVATSLVKDFGKPVFLWGRNGDNVIRGSCRSDGVADILKIMRETSPNYFLEFGGHTMSGGFSVSNENIHKLEEELLRSYEKTADKSDTEDNSQFVDRRMNIDDVNWATWRTVEQLAPYGVGNPKPLFLFENTELSAIKKFGKAKEHLELVFSNSLEKPVSAIQFFSNDLDRFSKKDKISFLATMEKSLFKNYPELRLRIVEILD